MVVVLGTDVHKGTHTTVAVNEVGRQLGQRTVRATEACHQQLLRWALREFGDAEAIKLAVEDCRHVSTTLERGLLAVGQAVVRVPPRLMAGARSSARTRGKSDPIDALAIARAALREPNLPVATHDSVSREVKLLVHHREDLVNERTRMQNRLRWHLHEVDPELDPTARSLDRIATLDGVAASLAGCPSAWSMVVRIATELVTDTRASTLRIRALERELGERMKLIAPRLLALPGCGPLCAAKIVSGTANATRFRSEACFAMHAGAVPIPASSGKTNRYRLAHGGDRQLNAAPHHIAVTQARLDGPGRDFYQRRLAMGNTKMEALRAIKRRHARVIFNLPQPDTTTQIVALPAAACRRSNAWPTAHMIGYVTPTLSLGSQWPPDYPHRTRRLRSAVPSLSRLDLASRLHSQLRASRLVPLVVLTAQPRRTENAAVSVGPDPRPGE